MKHPHENHNGNEVRRVGYGLGESLEFDLIYLIQKQRKDDGKGEAHEELIEADPQSISQHNPELVGIEEAIEMLQSDPSAPPEALYRNVIPEGDLDADHRQITKEDEVEQGRQEKEEVEFEIRLHPLLFQVILFHHPFHRAPF